MSTLLSKEQTIMGNIQKMYEELLTNYKITFSFDKWLNHVETDKDYPTFYKTWVQSGFDPRFEPTALRYGANEGTPQVERVTAYHVFPRFEAALIKNSKLTEKTMPQYLSDIRLKKMKELLDEGLTQSQVAMIFNTHRATVNRALE